jgi:general secretion pathway protein C
MSVNEFIFNPRVRQWLPSAINGGMLLLLIASLAQWTWLLVKPPLPPLVIAPPPPLVLTSAFSLQPLLAAHLFGQASQELTEQSLDKLPISSLNLILTGVIASDAGGYALISVSGQPQEAFAVGQIVAHGAVLQTVYPDRVVIRRNNALESLLLAESVNAPPSQVALTLAKPAPVVDQLTPNQIANASAESARETATDHHMVQRDQDDATMSPPDLMKQATLLPSRGGGVVVRLIQPGSLYEKMKMRSGDVIKSVNGQPVNTAQDAIGAYQQMPSMGSAQIEIVRNGRSEFLNYQSAQN